MSSETKEAVIDGKPVKYFVRQSGPRLKYDWAGWADGNTHHLLQGREIPSDISLDQFRYTIYKTYKRYNVKVRVQEILNEQTKEKIGYAITVYRKTEDEEE